MSTAIRSVARVARVARDSHINTSTFTSFSQKWHDVLDEKVVNPYAGNLKCRATRATIATQDAQHWLDAILDGEQDDAPLIESPPPLRATHKAFRVRLPGRPVFGVICPQGEDAVRAQWPGAEVELIV